MLYSIVFFLDNLHYYSWIVLQKIVFQIKLSEINNSWTLIKFWSWDSNTIRDLNVRYGMSSCFLLIDADFDLTETLQWTFIWPLVRLTDWSEPKLAWIKPEKYFIRVSSCKRIPSDDSESETWFSSLTECIFQKSLMLKHGNSTSECWYERR